MMGSAVEFLDFVKRSTLISKAEGFVYKSWCNFCILKDGIEVGYADISPTTPTRVPDGHIKGNRDIGWYSLIYCKAFSVRIKREVLQQFCDDPVYKITVGQPLENYPDYVEAKFECAQVTDYLALNRLSHNCGWHLAVLRPHELSDYKYELEKFGDVVETYKYQ